MKLLRRMRSLSRLRDMPLERFGTRLRLIGMVHRTL